MESPSQTFGTVLSSCAAIAIDWPRGLPQVSLFFSIVAEWRRHAFRSIARSIVGTELSEIGRGRIGDWKASLWYLRWRAIPQPNAMKPEGRANSRCPHNQRDSTCYPALDRSVVGSERRRSRRFPDLFTLRRRSAAEGLRPPSPLDQDVEQKELTIEKLVYGGDGLARDDGRIALVPFVLPGERVRAEVTRSKNDLLRGRASLEILAAAAERVAPPCPYFFQCGGCQYQHAT